MDKPVNFKKEYILTQDVPYECADENSKETNADMGMLFTGRVVWLDRDAAEPEGDSPIRVYADGIGTILLEQRFITCVK